LREQLISSLPERSRGVVRADGAAEPFVHRRVSEAVRTHLWTKVRANGEFVSKVMHVGSATQSRTAIGGLLVERVVFG